MAEKVDKLGKVDKLDGITRKVDKLSAEIKKLKAKLKAIRKQR